MAGFVTPPETWSVVHNPSTATQATISKAAPGASFKHVITAITVSEVCGATAQTPIHAHLRDGATGAGTILWSGIFGVLAGDSKQLALTGLWIPCTAGGAATLEFEGAGVANSQQSVAMTGVTVSA